MARAQTAPSKRVVVDSGRVFRPGVAAYWILRISGLILLVLVPLKIYTGYQLAGKLGGPSWLSAVFHLGNAMNALLIAAVLGHALMGLRVILLEWGLSQSGDRLFALLSLLGLVLFGIAFYVMVSG